MARETVAQAGGAAILAPPTGLPELAAICARADVFVGGDTGPLHIAAAAGTVCVGLHGTTRPEDSGAYGPLHIPLQARYHSGSSRERRNAENDAMREITVDVVLDACRTAIVRRRSQSAHECAA
jgi:ADP-heptose:LPS heptosyltransferase